MHEFLVLHYFATDSAQRWDDFLAQCLHSRGWVDASSRRATAMNMFDKSHIPPSHRRLAHQSWATSMYLLLDLLMGTGKLRYLCTRAPRVEDVRVDVRGFSAGSFSGLCLLHLLWRMPHAHASGTLGGIALPQSYCTKYLVIREHNWCCFISQLICYVNGTPVMIRCVSLPAKSMLYLENELQWLNDIEYRTIVVESRESTACHMCSIQNFRRKKQLWQINTPLKINGCPIVWGFMRWLFLCLIGFGSGMVAVAVDYSIDKVCFGLEQREEIQVRMCGQMIYVYTDFAQYTVRYVCLIYIYMYVYTHRRKDGMHQLLSTVQQLMIFLLCMR